MKTLVGVDGSEGSNFATSLVGRIHVAEADKIILYYSPPRMPGQGRAGQDANLVKNARQALADRVFAHTTEFLPESLADRAQRVVGTRTARDGIFAAAQQHRADLIAVGARGTNRFTKLLLGSVSHSVAHNGETPVLVARGTDNLQDRPLNVLIACDRSGVGAAAAALVKQLTWPADSVGYVVHVVESIFADQVPQWLKEEALKDESEPLSRVWVEEEARNRQQVHEELSDLSQALPVLFRLHFPVILEGHAGEKILEFINANKIDLAIVGMCHLGPIARFLGGSTSELVLGHAKCSVLVVPHHEEP